MAVTLVTALCLLLVDIELFGNCLFCLLSSLYVDVVVVSVQIHSISWVGENAFGDQILANNSICWKRVTKI